jgi:hypothetical protein
MPLDPLVSRLSVKHVGATNDDWFAAAHVMIGLRDVPDEEELMKLMERNDGRNDI